MIPFFGGRGRNNVSVTTKTLHVGDLAPDFTLETAEGRSFKLSKIVKKRPVLLFSIRGTW